MYLAADVTNLFKRVHVEVVAKFSHGLSLMYGCVHAPLCQVAS